jgi:hypothetical protein
MPGNEVANVDGGEMMDGGRRHRGSKKSRKGTRKQSKWMKHVMDTKRANKGKDLSEVLVIASKTYKKTGGGADSTAGGVAAGASPLTGGKRTRKSKKTRGSRKH